MEWWHIGAVIFVVFVVIKGINIVEGIANDIRKVGDNNKEHYR